MAKNKSAAELGKTSVYAFDRADRLGAETGESSAFLRLRIDEGNRRQPADERRLDAASDSEMGKIVRQTPDAKAARRFVAHRSGFDKTERVDFRPVHRRKHDRNRRQSFRQKICRH